MNLLRELLGAREPAPARHAVGTYNGFPIIPTSSWSTGGGERMVEDFVAYVEQGYRANGPVFAVILARLLLFSEARFKFRRLDNGRPGELFGTPALGVLERPWPKARTGDLLARMEQDVSLAGNSYTWRDPARRDRLRRLRPDWTALVVGVDGDPKADDTDLRSEILALLYQPGGTASSARPKILWPEDVAHYAPIPDPLSFARGMSWLTPVAREIDSDKSMTAHKGKFFDHAATPNMILKVAGALDDAVRERIEAKLRERYEGWENAYRTMLLEGGADATVVGNSFKEIDFSVVQAAGENRIAAAGGVPGIVVGLKEGLQAATYSNYQQAMRRFGDLTMRPLWRNAAGALEDIVDVPDGAELWYDAAGIPALAADAKDEAETAHQKSLTMRELIYAGYDPDSVTDAVNSGDFTRLVHTGAIPTALYPEGKAPAAAAPAKPKP